MFSKRKLCYTSEVVLHGIAWYYIFFYINIEILLFSLLELLKPTLAR